MIYHELERWGGPEKISSPFFTRKQDRATGAALY
jgi:hypothetical protein